jgi:hypothetical protein
MSADYFANAVLFQNGGVAEWLKAAVLKTADGKPSESSNLSSSARFYRPALSAGLFRFCLPLFFCHAGKAH